MPRQTRRKPLWQPPLALLLLAALVVGLALYAVPKAMAAPTTHTTYVTMPDGTHAGRSYFLHVTGTTPRPLLVVLHGWRLTPEQAEAQTGFTAYADSHGFDVAYPKSDDKPLVVERGWLLRDGDERRP